MTPAKASVSEVLDINMPGDFAGPETCLDRQQHDDGVALGLTGLTCIIGIRRSVSGDTILACLPNMGISLDRARA